MSFRLIWQRYFIKEVLKIFFLFLLCFFSLYVLIDYSMHMQEISKNNKISFINLLYYYGMLFSKRGNLLLPLSLLISSVKVLTSLNQRNEFLALQTAGIPTHILTRPFFFIGLICVGLNYFNYEIITPHSLNFIDQFEKNVLKKKNSKKNKSSVSALPLEDGTRLIYQEYNKTKKEFFDVYWIVSTNEIYHMQTLTIDNNRPVGTFVDVMQRNERNGIEKVSSHETYSFDSLPLNFHLESSFGKPMQHRSISELLKITLKKTPLFYENRSSVQTHLYFKLLMPWLPVLTLISIFPFCIYSSRDFSIFLTYSLTIFGYIIFFTVMDASVILGETRVVSPFLAIFSFPILFCLIFGSRFLRTCVRS